MKFVGLGVSHRSAAIEVRERLARSLGDLEDSLKQLVKGGAIREACIVSTCNRIEFYVAGEASPDVLASDLRAHLMSRAGLSPKDLDGLYMHLGDRGLLHLFRVASSLDSMVLGEPQILGQVKEAFRTAERAKSVGPELTRIFQKTFQVAKRVRTVTGIAENAVSMSFAAVELARDIFQTLDAKNVLVIGAGKMSALAARHLKAQGVSEIRVANRTLERAMELAQEIGGVASNLADLEFLLARADIVISSTAAPGFVVDRKLMTGVVRERRYRPILFVDLAVPRDIDPDVAELEGVFVYDVDDLQGVVVENQRQRAKEASAAEALVGEEVAAFLRWSKAQEVVPVIKALRRRASEIADEEVRRTLGQLKEPDPKVEKSVKAMSQAIVNKLLHPVMTKLKAEGADGDASRMIDTLTTLFELELAAADREERSEHEGKAGEEPNVVELRREPGR